MLVKQSIINACTNLFESVLITILPNFNKLSKKKVQIFSDDSKTDYVFKFIVWFALISCWNWNEFYFALNHNVLKVKTIELLKCLSKRNQDY